ncbi:MAG: LysE family translocator [Calditrichaeota bacterium]|nr:LysE family translocator [Calditrichota bacterium]
MVPTQNLVQFVFAAILLVVTPGPAVLYIVTRSIDLGKKAGLISVLGILTGGFIHVIIATLGIAAIFATTPIAFNVLKYFGAAYLLYLGISTLKTNGKSKNANRTSPKENIQLYRQGVWVNLLNPKAALFLLAFLPQFTDSVKEYLSVQIFILGILFITIAAVSDAIYALLAGKIGYWLKQHPKLPKYQKYFAATIYSALGIFAAVL